MDIYFVGSKKMDVVYKTGNCREVDNGEKRCKISYLLVWSSCLRNLFNLGSFSTFSESAAGKNRYIVNVRFPASPKQ